MRLCYRILYTLLFFNVLYAFFYLCLGIVCDEGQFVTVSTWVIVQPVHAWDYKTVFRESEASGVDELWSL